jgi:hypothetical protein
MPDSLPQLEARRADLFRQLEALGDFRRGTAGSRTTGKPARVRPTSMSPTLLQGAAVLSRGFDAITAARGRGCGWRLSCRLGKDGPNFLPVRDRTLTLVIAL